MENNQKIQLDDLVYTYPSVKDEFFQTKISAKKEFRELAATAVEKVPKRGELFKQQSFLKRFMRQYDKSFIMWKTGTGKTCGVLSVTEDYKNMKNSPIKHAYILVKGPSLINEFKYQLVCKCTDGVYETDLVKNAPNKISRKRNITNELKKFYTITTYSKFAKKIAKEKSDLSLIKKYSGSIFIIDEVHNLRIESSKNRTLFVENKLNQPTKSKVRDQLFVYQQIHRLFHLAKRSKFMIMSATPMINKPSEIGPLMNLLLPLDHQLPNEESFYDNVSLKEIEPYFRGKITYVRELDTGALVMYKGEPLGTLLNVDGKQVKAQSVVYKKQMSEFQEKQYKLAVTSPASFLPEEKRSQSTRPEAFSRLLQQASNFVFPNGKTGTYGFRDYIEKTGTSRYKANSELLPYLQNNEQLRILSCKFAETINICKNKPGNCWCYSDLLSGSGAILLSLCFEAQGFEHFREKRSIFMTEKSSSMEPYCKSNDTTNTERQTRIKKGVFRYAILTSENQSDHSVILDTFNSYENRHGELIKVIIGSPVTQVGLNLANVLQVILIGPSWNLASSYQAISRAIRSTSHVDLIEERKRELQKLGKDPYNASVPVNIYRLAAITSDGTSIDIHKYEESEIKDRRIKRIYLMMKQCAVDCQINYYRNVRPNDVNGSSTCDYSDCNYQCVDPQPKYLDVTSFNVLYSGEIIDEVIQSIREIFEISFTLNIKQLYSKLKQYDTKFIDMAIEKIISDKKPINDRYGYRSYIQEDKGNLFLQRDFPTSSIENKKYALSYYTSTLIGINKNSLENYVSQLNLEEQKSKLVSIWQLDTNDPGFQNKFDNIINNLSLDSQALILETAAYSAFILGNTSDVVRAVINKYRLSFFAIYEPIELIESTAKALSKRSKGRGRPPKEGSKSKIKSLNLSIDSSSFLSNQSGNEKIYVHNLYTKKFGQTSYSVTARFKKNEGRIRILKPSEGTGWRNANPYEFPVYNAFINSQIQTIVDQYDKYPIYGSIFEDGKFRIHDNRDPQNIKQKDKRKNKRGLVCSSWKKAKLIEILWELQIMPFKTSITLSRNELISALQREKLNQSGFDINSFSDDKLLFYYIWLNSAVNRNQICNILKKSFAEKQLLLTIS